MSMPCRGSADAWLVAAVDGDVPEAVRRVAGLELVAGHARSAESLAARDRAA